jgi:hypothetical protein
LTDLQVWLGLPKATVVVVSESVLLPPEIQGKQLRELEMDMKLAITNWK